MNNDSQVTILTYSPEPERICAAAAKISTTFGSALETYENMTNDLAVGLIPKVLSLGHISFIEHVNFTIAFENVSVYVEQFFIEFRLASFTVKSRRYVDFSKMGYYVPEFEANQITSRRDLQSNFKEHINFLFSEYNYFVDKGIPKEDARFLLPYCYRSNFYCTVNARELIHMICAAIYGRGKGFLEIRKIGESLLQQAKRICPSIFDNIEEMEIRQTEKGDRIRKLTQGCSFDRKNHGEISELISYTDQPDKMVAISTIINHTLCSTSVAEKLVDSSHELLEEAIQIACEDKRNRELEQVNFSFRINDLSLAGLTHLVRHRIQSINVPSFIEYGKSSNYIIPETIASNVELLNRYNSIWDKHNAIFIEFKRNGVSKEDLVYLYLSGNVIDIVTTMNARQLFHFMKLRTCYRAQWEIRNIAIDMLKKVKKVAPNTFKRVGPACVLFGQCPEGKLSCGNMIAVNEEFRGF